MFRGLAVLTLVLSISAPVRAQVLYGSVVGTVEDSTGAVVQGASVVLTSSESGQNRAATTNESGLYSIGNVLAGNYQLKVTATGFRPFVETNLAVTINNVARINVKLEVGGTTEQVTVEASARSCRATRPTYTWSLTPRRSPICPWRIIATTKA